MTSLENRGSTSSETEVEACETYDGPTIEMLPVETSQEIYLSNDLADYLVNLPADPESSDVEIPQKAVHLSVIETVNDIKFNQTVNDDMEVSEITKNMICMTNRENKELDIETKDSLKCINLSTIPLEEVEEKTDLMTESKSTTSVQELELDNTEVVKEVPEALEKRSRTREPDKNLNSVLTPELDSQVMKSEDQSSDHKPIKKSYSSVIKSYLVRESNDNPTISCQLKIEPAATSSPTTISSNSRTVQNKSEGDSDNWEKVPSNVSKLETWGKTSKKRKCKS